MFVDISTPSKNPIRTWSSDTCCPSGKTWKLHWPRALDLVWYCWCFRHAALRSPAIGEVGRLSHYFQGFSTIPGGCLGFLNHQQYCMVFSHIFHSIPSEASPVGNSMHPCLRQFESSASELEARGTGMRFVVFMVLKNTSASDTLQGTDIWMFPKNRYSTPKMDGLLMEKPY